MPVWAINQVAHHDRDAVARLLAAADRLKSTQVGRAKGADDLRTVADAYQVALTRVIERVAAVLQEAGTHVTTAVRNRLTRTLAAAVAQSPLRDALREGRLSRELEPAGFDILAGAQPQLRVVKAARSLAPTSAPAPPKPARATPQQLTRAQADLRGAEAEFARATTRATQLARDATAARQRAAEAQRMADEAQADAALAATRVRTAEQAVRAAEGQAP